MQTLIKTYQASKSGPALACSGNAIPMVFVGGLIVALHRRATPYAVWVIIPHFVTSPFKTVLFQIFLKNHHDKDSQNLQE